MSIAKSNVPDEFPLNTMGPVLGRFSPPLSFDPAGPWENTYGVYTLVGAGRVGSLRLERKVGAGGRVTLDVRYEKGLTDGRQEVVGAMQLGGDAPLSTPVAWTFQTQVFDAEGRRVPYTRLQKSATVGNDAIEIRDSGGIRRLPVRGPYTLNWALFDAVGRLPREKTEPLDFTLIDHFDQLKPNQTLCFRKTTTVTVAGNPLRLHAYDQIGEGIVPWVYWVDDQGRLLFVVSGLEGYLWEPSREPPEANDKRPNRK